MRHYDSFENINNDKTLMGEEVWAFNKLDGQNLGARYNARTKQFSGFCSRNCIVDETDEMFGPAVMYFQTYIKDILLQLIEKYRKKGEIFNGVDELMFYFEWYGDNSFAGVHQEGDLLRLALTDVFIKKKGYIDPKSFYSMFSNVDGLEIPDLIYRGKLNKEFIDSIYNNNYLDPSCKYPSVKEGVVCRRSTYLKGQRMPKVKIKTKMWLDKIHEKFSSNLWKELE